MMPGRDMISRLSQGLIRRPLPKRKKGTVQNGRMVCPETGETFSIASIRGDRRMDGETVYGLRLWENEDLIPRPDDVFQERLYCVRWMETYLEENRQGELVEKTRRHYCPINDDDLRREDKVLTLLKERFSEWQEKGFIPSRAIEPGAETSRLQRERGWTHWHHLFNPRQLLMHGELLKTVGFLFPTDSMVQVALTLLLGRCTNLNSKLCIWDSSLAKSGGIGAFVQTFSNQAFNTLYNFGSRAGKSIKDTWYKKYVDYYISGTSSISPNDAREVCISQDIWLTDPPYADAVNYHELLQFYIAWYEKKIWSIFPDWYTDTKKALAIRGSSEDFKRAMVDSYANLTKHMPENGLQLVMFTHQDASVWADLAMILWAAGLKVTAAWTIATETISGLKKGNYVQGTVLLILRKRTTNETAFLDELYPEIEDEVRHQLDQMLALDDKEEPNFADTDYQLAAYAAALRVLTSYSEIEGPDIRHELFWQKQTGETSAFEQVINRDSKRSR